MKRTIAEYRSVRQASEIEFEIRRSRFIGICRPLENAADAERMVTEQRERFPDATHHVYAWIISKGMRMQRYSDDGEPKGTAGLPVLDVLIKQGIDQAGIVVIRYFGGIQLGAGGLVRAYAKAASLAVEQAQPVLWQRHRLIRLTGDYSCAERLRYQIGQNGYWQGEPVYGANVCWQTAAIPEQVETLLALIRDVTHDSVAVELDEMTYRPVEEQGSR